MPRPLDDGQVELLLGQLRGLRDRAIVLLMLPASPRRRPLRVQPLPDCAKFVSTPEYAPRLRARREVEQTLALDAAQRGWDREVERHRCTSDRIDKLLADLGLPAHPEGKAENISP
ncbi:hypothetical protein A6A29_33910 [Streptomyces sp. TSRI0281]|nr:hypothetical protein A6A29_33910 [Streptomyces sp. TSRI0281]